MSPENEKYAEKIAKLLRKAESTDSQAEAESFTAKAQELMTTYAIDAAMLERSADKPREEVIEKRIKFEGVYQAAHYEIGSQIAQANNCRVLVSRWSYGHKETTLHVIGFESDVARVELFNSSLMIQAQAALNRWWKDPETKISYEWQSQWEKTKARRSFLFGFANGVGHKLRAAAKEGEDEAARHEADREEVSQEEASESVALVIRSRKDQVNDWVDNTYGELKSARGRYTEKSGGGSAAGRQAGMNADLGGGISGGNGGLLGA